MQAEELLTLARRARENAHAPYSHYATGAALLASDGKVYTGCNVESASYGLTCCAERTALFTAVAAGEREFVAIAVVTENGAYPCGACRQLLSEFGPQLRIYAGYAAPGDGAHREMSMSELLPDSFGHDDLPRT